MLQCLWKLVVEYLPRMDLHAAIDANKSQLLQKLIPHQCTAVGLEFLSNPKAGFVLPALLSPSELEQFTKDLQSHQEAWFQICANPSCGLWIPATRLDKLAGFALMSNPLAYALIVNQKRRSDLEVFWNELLGNEDPQCFDLALQIAVFGCERAALPDFVVGQMKYDLNNQNDVETIMASDFFELAIQEQERGDTCSNLSLCKWMKNPLSVPLLKHIKHRISPIYMLHNPRAAEVVDFQDFVDLKSQMSEARKVELDARLWSNQSMFFHMLRSEPNSINFTAISGIRQPIIMDLFHQNPSAGWNWRLLSKNPCIIIDRVTANDLASCVHVAHKRPRED